MPSEIREKQQLAPRRDKTKEMRKPKTIKNQQDGEKLRNLLDSCLELFSKAYEKGEDIFRYLDPMVSDTQCHMHSLLLLNILRKCSKTEEEDDDTSILARIKMLKDKDREILSYGILLSLLKMSKRDVFGMILYEVALRHFNGTIVNSKKRERNLITKIRKDFNSYSVDYIKSICSENTIKEMFTECKAFAVNIGLKFLPCYASIYAVINYTEENNYPIIVSMININVDGDHYYLTNSQVIYYEYREPGAGESRGDGNKRYFYKENLSEYEKNLPTITYDCYMLIDASHSGPKEFVKDCDIKNLLLMSSAGHIQLPCDSQLPEGYKDVEEYSRELYKIDNNFLIRYMKHYQLAKKENLIEARYAKPVRIIEELSNNDKSLNYEEENNNNDKNDNDNVMESHCASNSFVIERRQDEIIFGMDHIYLSNYTRQYNNRVKNFNINFHLKSKVNKRENIEIDTDKQIDEVMKMLISNQNDLRSNADARNKASASSSSSSSSFLLSARHKNHIEHT